MTYLKLRIFLMLLGILSILGYITSPTYVTEYSKFKDTTIKSDINLYTYRQKVSESEEEDVDPLSWQLVGPENFIDLSIEIRYPVETNSDKSIDIELDSQIKGYFQDLPSSFWLGFIYSTGQFIIQQGRKISVKSPAFDIEPEDGHLIPKGTTESFSIRWTCRPKSTGDHKFILNLSDLRFGNHFLNQTTSASGEIFLTDQYRINEQVTINSTELPKEELPHLSMPITVYNVLGITEAQFLFVRGFLLILGAVLVIPFLQPYFSLVLDKRQIRNK